MQIFHYDPETFVYIGSGIADESPLEPGIFLLPAYSTDVAPPPVALQQRAVWAEGQWTVEAIPEPPAPEEPTPAEPGPNFPGFLNAIIASPLYQKVLEQSSSSLPVNTAFTALMGALILAANGVPNPLALQSGLDDLLAAMVTTAEDLSALEEMLQTNGLEGLIEVNTP